MLRAKLIWTEIGNAPLRVGKIYIGGMAEWLKAAVLKTAEGSRLPWVQILLPPPVFFNDFTLVGLVFTV